MTQKSLRHITDSLHSHLSHIAFSSHITRPFSQPLATECVSDLGKTHCADLGGICETERDGYYIVSAACVMIGATILTLYVIPTARRLQGMYRLRVLEIEILKSVFVAVAFLALPVSKWRVSASSL